MPSPDTAPHLLLRVVLSTVLATLLLAAGGMAFMSLKALKRPPARSTAPAPRPAVQVAAVHFGPYQERLTGYGRARALRETRVAAEVTGVISWIAEELEPGAAVAAGAELVRLDPGDLDSAVARAEADRDQARARVQQTTVDRDGIQKRLAVAREELKTSRDELARSEALVGDDIVSQNEVDQLRRASRLLERTVLDLEAQELGAGPRIDRDRADLKRAEAVLEQARRDRERAVIRAPYAGRVAARAAQLGARVSPGVELFTILDPTRVEVPVALPASRFAEVKAGSRAELRLEEGGEVHWTGVVARVAPLVQDAQRTFDAFLVVESRDFESVISPGAFVVATVDGRLHEDVAAVPRVAFVGEQVFVAEPSLGEAGEGEARARAPAVVRWLPDVALIRGGLEEGARVIVTNLERIADSSLIRIGGAADGGAAGAADHGATHAPDHGAQSAPGGAPAPAASGRHGDGR